MPYPLFSCRTFASQFLLPHPPPRVRQRQRDQKCCLIPSIIYIIHWFPVARPGTAVNGLPFPLIIFQARPFLLYLYGKRDS